MRVTSKGRVTIPREIREALDVVPSGEVEFVREAGRVWLRKRRPGTTRARDIVRRMRGRATAHMSAEEIMWLTRGDEA